MALCSSRQQTQDDLAYSFIYVQTLCIPYVMLYVLYMWLNIENRSGLKGGVSQKLIPYTETGIEEHFWCFYLSMSIEYFAVALHLISTNCYMYM